MSEHAFGAILFSVLTNSAILQATMTNTWKTTYLESKAAKSQLLSYTSVSGWRNRFHPLESYHLVVRSIHFMDRELASPVTMVKAAITLTVSLFDGKQVKSDPIETAASNKEDAPHSEDATPAT